jgi:hypothetical protein
MQVNYNIGLSYFNLMAQTTDMTDKRSEPYFKKSAELGPQFGGSFFYLGLIKENMYGDSKAAKAYYQKACDLKYEPACRSLKTILQRTAGAPSTSAVAAVSPDDESLYDQIERAYVRKGVTEKSLSSVMTNIKAAYSQMPAAQRKTALEHMIQGLR